jgi:hypothetical protein
MKRPRDIAERSRELRDLRRLYPDGFLRETFTLPVEDARAKVRETLGEYPAAGYMTIIENWRQLVSRWPDRVHNAAVADGGLTLRYR